MSDLYPKRESNVKLTLEQQRAASRPKPGGMTCYDVAKVRGITPDEAARQMAAEGWQFAGYGDYGDEFLPPGA